MFASVSGLLTNLFVGAVGGVFTGPLPHGEPIRVPIRFFARDNRNSTFLELSVSAVTDNWVPNFFAPARSMSMSMTVTIEGVPPDVHLIFERLGGCVPNVP